MPKFDKPIVLPSDIQTITAAYPFGKMLESENLGGIGSMGFDVVGSRYRGGIIDEKPRRLC